MTGPRLRAVVALLACGIAAGCDWPWRHDMADQPSPSAASGPRSPALDSIPTEARGPFDREAGESISNPLPAGAGVDQGRELYRIYCIPCHGGPVEKFFPPMPPLVDPNVQRHGDGWMYATITNGTRLMPAYGHELDPAERWAVVQFVRSMAGR